MVQPWMRISLQPKVYLTPQHRVGCQRQRYRRRIPGLRLKLTVSEEDFSRNNWRGRRTGVLGPATTGAKYSGLANGTIYNIVANDNHGSGLWFNYNSQAVTVLESTFSFNSGAGIYFEANDAWPNPAADSTSFVVDCTLEGNAVGVQAISTRDVRLENNVLTANPVALGLIGTPRIDSNGGPTMYLRDGYVTENTLDATCPHHLWLHYGDGQLNNDYSEWQLVMQSLLSDYNDFSHPSGSGTEGFLIKTAPASLTTWQTCSLATHPWCSQAQDGSSQFVP